MRREDRLSAVVFNASAGQLKTINHCFSNDIQIYVIVLQIHSLIHSLQSVVFRQTCDQLFQVFFSGESGLYVLSFQTIVFHTNRAKKITENYSQNYSLLIEI